jgi:membrane fusion protein, multidrug efflux system
MKISNKVIFILTICIISMSIACKKKEVLTNDITSNVLNQKTIVKTTQPFSANGSEVIKVLGIVTSDKEAKPSFKTGGVIAKTYLKEGDIVKKGQLLSTLVMNEIDAQVRQAEEGLSKAQRDVNRVQRLHADSVATLEQLQNATTAYEVAKKTVEIAKFNRQYSEVRSPIAGRIVKQIMHEGEVTGPGTPIYAIMGTGNADWRISAGLIDRDWARVNVGDKATLVLDAFPTKNLEAVITDKSVIGGNASSTIDVELKFQNTPPNLAAGLIGKLTIAPKQSNSETMTISIEALTKSNGNTAIVYLHKQGKAVKKMINIGNILGDKVEVISGLSATDEVVTIGSMYLEDGDDIVVQK